MMEASWNNHNSNNNNEEEDEDEDEEEEEEEGKNPRKKGFNNKHKYKNNGGGGGEQSRFRKGESKSGSSNRRETRKERRLKDKRDKNNKKGKDWRCSYCSLVLFTRNEFLNHCSSQKHQRAITSDEGRAWKYRPPPRGFGSETYQMCQNMSVEGVCRHGDQCVDAHTQDELIEWKERFEFRQKKAFKANKIFGKSFVDIVVEKLNNSSNPNSILRHSLEGTSCAVDRDLSATISNKTKSIEWTFHICTTKMMRHVALLSDENRIHFNIMSVKHQGVSDTKEVLKTYNTDLSQEWIHPEVSFFSSCREMEYKIKIGFSAEFFGAFNQTVVFNFGGLNAGDLVLLKRDLRVDVTPEEDESKGEGEGNFSVADETKFEDILIRQPDRWDETNSIIFDIDPPVNVPSQEARSLYKIYPPPQPSKFKISQYVKDSRLTKSNYRGRMHELLFIEEMAQYEQVSQFNVVAKLELASRYFLTPMSTTSSTAKYSRSGELFGKMVLGSNLNEDTSAGRLILTNCSTLLLSQPGYSPENGEKREAFVSVIEDSGKNTLYLRLSVELVSRFNLNEDETFEVEIQFQLNRLPICEMHLAVDRLPDLELVYPNLDHEITVPWSTGRHWSSEFDSCLNPKQREAIVAITTSKDVVLPPILIIGPYGTGKTFTLGQSLKMLLKDRMNRILVCTHSNSAADLYIREYLHPYVTETNAKISVEKEESEDKRQETPIKILRVYYENRWVKTVHDTVLKYCLVTTTEHLRSFRNPTYEDVCDCNIVVATLSTSKNLTGLGLPKGHFTHVFIDEAAQAMECEAIMALALASVKTRVVLAGDHMQLSPEVFSKFASEKKFNKSLLERLYDYYPQYGFPCKILLCENYRSHGAIIEYTSDLFYEQKLVASGKQTRHDLWYPLTLFTARGEDIQDMNSTSFYNNAEVYEVVERVTQLQLTWPKSWGRRDETSIGIVTPYYDQVQRIRSELRKRNLFGVSVERVLNVQGKQFRAIFLSTVRTRKTCVMSQEDPEIDFGFLSNAKLLNTAITRAQSLVAVVGDPVALCSIGKCRKMWEKFVEICSKYSSFFGLTYQALRAMLDNVEFKKTYVLNPYAPVFVPRYAKQQQRLNQRQNYQNLCRINAVQGVFNPFVPPIPPPPPPWMKYGPPPPPNMPPPILNHGWPPLTSISANDKQSSSRGARANGVIPPRHNPQFNSAAKFNRYESPPPIVGRGQSSNNRSVGTTIPSSTPSSSATSNDLVFFGDGVHFPTKPNGQFRNPPPNNVSHSSNNEEILQFAMQLLPEDIDLATFLKSNQMQVAWYNHLQVSRGTKEAVFFKNFIVHLQSNPNIVLHLNKQLVARKILSLTGEAAGPSTTGGATFHQPPPTHQASAILAQDLEAQFMQQDSVRNQFPQNQVEPNSFLLPSAKSTDHFFSLSNRLEPHNEASGVTPNEDDLFDPQNLILSEILDSTNGDDLLFDNSPKTDTGPKVPLYMRRPGVSNSVAIPANEPPRPETSSSSSLESPFNLNLNHWGKQIPKSFGEIPPRDTHIFPFKREQQLPQQPAFSNFEEDRFLLGEPALQSEKPLTYANVLLRNQTNDKNCEERDSDPIARIRNLGISSSPDEGSSINLRLRDSSILGGGGVGDFRLFDNASFRKW